jgi:hypothetical protein
MNDKALRKHLLNLLDGKGAHVDFDGAVAGLAVELRGKKVPDVPYTAWQLLEHLRIAQWDIVEFSKNPDHVSPEWPKEYWPPSEEPPGPGSWDESVEQFHKDLQAMKDLVADPKTDLFEKIHHGTGQTILREGLLVADHNAYHIGELVLLRRLLGTWPPK